MLIWKSHSGKPSSDSFGPAGVSWFEVDRSDVLMAKHKALKQAGAAFSEAENKKGGAYSREDWS